MVETPAHAGRQQRIDDLCAAAIRALCGRADVHFRGQRLYAGARALAHAAPHLYPARDSDDFGSFRGAADGHALRLTHSDAALHVRLSPPGSVEPLLFDLLEQFRVESLAAPQLPGLRHNLRHCFEQWSLAYHHSGLNESARGILLYAAAQACRSRVSGEPPLAQTEELIDGTRGMISRRITHDLAGLRRQRHDQAAYAVHAQNIARIVGELMASRDDERGDDENEGVDARNDFRLLPEFDGRLNDGVSVAGSGAAPTRAAAAGGYRVFTRAYDREVHAATLVRRALLAEYRTHLDRRIAERGINLTRLARDLQTLLAMPVADGWDSGHEEGVIDGRRLAQLVSSPSERRLFRVDRQQPRADCRVTFLIDCSGSMKPHIEAVAIVTDVFARALEMAGAHSEILGFTTGAWSGGRAWRDWQRAGKPASPGRLNELCHLVFKDAATPWRRARPATAALLKPDLFREGVNGEAVDWACARMQAAPEFRHLLLVISDGSPMDSATHLANGPHYLDQHLRETIMRHEQSGQVAILGIGVGLDLSAYYRHSLGVDLATAQGNHVFNGILALLASGARHPHRHTASAAARH